MKENFKEVWYLYHTHSTLREEYPDRDFSVSDLEAFFYSKYPDSNRATYDGLFKDLSDCEVSEEVGYACLEAIKRRKALLKLSELAYRASTGTAEIAEVQSVLEELTDGRTEVEVAEDSFITTNLEEIVNATVAKPGIRWPLGCLNKSLGSLRKGDFGFVFARPETGKTTFIAGAAASALGQVDRPVVWFNNEEQDDKVMLRVVQSYFGITLMELMGNVKKYNALFNEQVGKKFLLVNSSRVDINRSSVERILDARRPSLIIYDQIDKIKGFKADRDDLLLGAIYQWARELAKIYAPSIAVCQADGTGEGQKWLTMANVANAKTSKQAEADWILGIGKTHDAAAEYVRYLNISKNKLMGDSDSEPSLRHGRFEVIIEPEVARYKDVINYG